MSAPHAWHRHRHQSRFKPHAFLFLAPKCIDHDALHRVTPWCVIPCVCDGAFVFVCKVRHYMASGEAQVSQLQRPGAPMLPAGHKGGVATTAHLFGCAFVAVFRPLRVPSAYRTRALRAPASPTERHLRIWRWLWLCSAGTPQARQQNSKVSKITEAGDCNRGRRR